MAAIGGPLQEIAIKGRVFPVASDGDANRKLGGRENEVAMNGNGKTARIIQTLVAWSYSGIQVEIDDLRADQEFLNDLATAGEPVTCSFTHADGTVYSASGVPTGEVVRAAKNATATINLSGPGKLEKQ